MSKELQEAQVGQDPTQIVYPTINSCITVTAIKGTVLIGGHFVQISEAMPPAKVFQAMELENRLVPIGKVTQVFVVGDLCSWTTKFLWPADFLKEIAKVWGFVRLSAYETAKLGTVTVTVTRKTAELTEVSYAKEDRGVVGTMFPILPDNFKELGNEVRGYAEYFAER